MSSGVNDIAQVGWIATILMLSVILNYPLTSITLSQASVTAG
jgi:hypothetical protein